LWGGANFIPGNEQELKAKTLTHQTKNVKNLTLFLHPTTSGVLMKIFARPLKLTLDGIVEYAIDCHDPRLLEYIDDPRIFMSGEGIVLVIDKQFIESAGSTIKKMQATPKKPEKPWIITVDDVEIVGEGLETHRLNSLLHDLSRLLDTTEEIRADRLVLHLPNEDLFAAWLGRMYFRPYHPDLVPPEPEVLTEKQIENLGKRWDSLGLSERTLGVLEHLGHTHIWQTAEKTEAELIKEYAHRKALHEIKEALAELKLHLDMTIPDEIKDL